MVAGAPQTDAQVPQTCNVLGLVCFGHGAHKDGKDFYSPAMVDRIADNFKRLPGKVPQAKIGHDKRQLMAERLKQSLGFPAVGQVTRCDKVPGYPGFIEVDIRNVPTKAVGGEIAAGRLNSTSVELNPSERDPNDPSKIIEGPILTGIAFLGEEQPAVRNWPAELRERAKPKATFADGSPVPPNPDIPPQWLDAMSDVSRQIAREFSGDYSPERGTITIRGRDYSAAVACFSDLSPAPSEPIMTPEKEAALVAAGFSPDEIAAMKAALPGAGPIVEATPVPPPSQMAAEPDGDEAMMSACKKFAEDPNATPGEKMMAQMYSAMSKKFSDMTKRFGAVEAVTAEKAKKDEADKMAAFSAGIAERCERLINAGKMSPFEADSVVKPRAKIIGESKTFSSESDRTKVLSDLFRPYEDGKVDPAFVAKVSDLKHSNGKRELTKLQQDMVRKDSLLSRERPELARKLRELAAAQ